MIKDTNTILSRRAGKSFLARLWAEAALDSGKVVYFVGNDHTTRQRRKKHLTMIEAVKKTDRPVVIIHDELYSI